MSLNSVASFQRLREPGTRSAAVIMLIETALLVLSGATLLALTAVGYTDDHSWPWALIAVPIASALLKLIPPVDDLASSMVVDARGLHQGSRTASEIRTALATPSYSSGERR